MRTTAERLLVLLLRMVGGMECLAIFPALMPRTWMALVHEHIGLGPFPEGPVVEYLARSLSALYAVNGGLMLVVSTDVRRYAALVTFSAAAAVAAGLLVLVTDLSVGMPWWWTAGEGPFLMAFGVVLLTLQARAGRASGGPSAPSC
ncbi:MAG: hypothetical protein FJ290_24225 [Planctomycetes bacterium]|nr:hypothetical protein [Planctomycetota bacterium]